MKGDILIYDNVETKALLDTELDIIVLTSAPLLNEKDTLLITIEELDSIYVAVHKDDEPVTEPEPSCRKCIYRRICEVGPRSANVCTNYTLPEEWEEGEPAEVEKLVCGNCYYVFDTECGFGECFRYPPTENCILVSEITRACGEHRLRE